MTNRVQVRAADVLACTPEGRFDVAVLRNLIQVLGPDEACRALRNVGAAMEPGGLLIIVGHVLQDSRLEPIAAVGFNLVFLSIYDAGQAYTEREHRSWLDDAGFADIEVQYGAAPAGMSIVLARKTR